MDVYRCSGSAAAQQSNLPGNYYGDFSPATRPEKDASFLNTRDRWEETGAAYPPFYDLLDGELLANPYQVNNDELEEQEQNSDEIFALELETRRELLELVHREFGHAEALRMSQPMFELTHDFYGEDLIPPVAHLSAQNLQLFSERFGPVNQEHMQHDETPHKNHYKPETVPKVSRAENESGESSGGGVNESEEGEEAEKQTSPSGQSEELTGPSGNDVDRSSGTDDGYTLDGCSANSTNGTNATSSGSACGSATTLKKNGSSAQVRRLSPSEGEGGREPVELKTEKTTRPKEDRPGDVTREKIDSTSFRKEPTSYQHYQVATELLSEDQLGASMAFSVPPKLKKEMCQLNSNKWRKEKRTGRATNESLMRRPGGNTIPELARGRSGIKYLKNWIASKGSYKFLAAQLVWKALMDDMVEVAKDAIAHNLIVSLLDTVDSSSRLCLLTELSVDQIVMLGKHEHGTHVVQKLFDAIDTKLEEEELLSRLKLSHVQQLSCDIYGMHVILRLLKNQFINNNLISVSILKNLADIVTHKHGCCVVQWCLKYSKSNDLIRTCVEMAESLAVSEHGNYVVQQVMSNYKPWRNTIFSKFSGRYVELANQKFSSMVVEKCLKLACPNWRSIIITELCEDSKRLTKLLEDKYGNYVIQTALNVSKGATRLIVEKSIRPLLPFIAHKHWMKRLKATLNKTTNSSPVNSSGRTSPKQEVASSSRFHRPADAERRTGRKTKKKNRGLSPMPGSVSPRSTSSTKSLPGLHSSRASPKTRRSAKGSGSSTATAGPPEATLANQHRSPRSSRRRAQAVNGERVLRGQNTSRKSVGPHQDTAKARKQKATNSRPQVAQPKVQEASNWAQMIHQNGGNKKFLLDL